MHAGHLEMRNACDFDDAHGGDVSRVECAGIPGKSSGIGNNRGGGEKLLLLENLEDGTVRQHQHPWAHFILLDNFRVLNQRGVLLLGKTLQDFTQTLLA